MPGTVFKFTANSNRAWTESVLSAYMGTTDRAIPLGGLIFDNAGNLYGTVSDTWGNRSKKFLPKAGPSREKSFDFLRNCGTLSGHNDHRQKRKIGIIIMMMRGLDAPSRTLNPGE